MHRLRSILLPFAFATASLLSAQPPASVNQKDALGRKQGLWRKPWADSQQTRYEGNFKNDKPIGRFTYFSTTGKIESYMDYYPNSDAAHAKHMHPSGKLMAEGRYVGQAKDSTWNYYNEDAKVISTEHWKLGKKEGDQLSYFADGTLAEQCAYSDDKQHGPCKQFFANGKLHSVAIYEHGLPVGIMTWYYPNGQKEVEGKVLNGEREGTWMYYNEDGSVQIQLLYKEGMFVKDKKENGTFKEYYDDEQVKSEGIWKNGKREGKFTEYYDNGSWVTKPTKLGPDGAEVGQEERVLEGQTKKREGTYKNDMLDGELRTYDEKGKLMASEIYVNGTIAGKGQP